VVRGGVTSAPSAPASLLEPYRATAVLTGRPQPRMGLVRRPPKALGPLALDPSILSNGERPAQAERSPPCLTTRTSPSEASATPSLGCPFPGVHKAGGQAGHKEEKALGEE